MTQMALFLSHSVIDRLLMMQEVLEVVETAFTEHGAGEALSFPRQRMGIPGGIFRSMSGAMPSRKVFGNKSGLHQFDFAEGVAKASAQVLYSSETGGLLAFLWSDLITDYRTGAMGGVSARYLSRADSTTIGLLGSGRQARTQLLAVSLARPPERVLVFSRNRRNREGFARRMAAEIGASVEPVDSAESAVRPADIVIAATNSTVPVFEGRWLGQGTHVISIRSSYGFDPATGGERREIDDETVERCDLVTVDYLQQAEIQESPEIGDRIRAHQVFELGKSITGRAPTRETADQITLFKSFGMGLVDVAVANHVYEKAVSARLGVEMEAPLVDLYR